MVYKLRAGVTTKSHFADSALSMHIVREAGDLPLFGGVSCSATL